MNRNELESALGKYQFYHSIELDHGLFTAGTPKMIPQQNLTMRNLRSLPLAGRRVLDIGCRDGLFSFEAERMGAAEVIGVDNDLSLGATELLIPYLKSSVRMYEMNLLDLTPATFGTFDVIIFSGVLYHLRYPFHGLKIIRELLKEGGTLLLETAILPAWERYPFLYCPTGDESPYEATSVTFFNNHAMRSTLQSLGYKVVSTDHLWGRKRASGAGRAGHLARAIAVAVQSRIPGLMHRLAGRFVIDRGVFVCTTGDATPHLQAYWESTHPMHTAAVESPDGALPIPRMES